MSSIAIITARGGSKRIPGKNIKDFNGKPIISYSIEAALQCKLFDEVMVSTDDARIAEIAKNYGASVPFLRSNENSDDLTGPGDAVVEVIGEYKNIGRSFETGCCIYATAPLLSATKLIDAHELLLNSEFDTVFPVVKIGAPIWRSYKREEDGKVVMNFPEHAKMRSQDLQPAFQDAGQFYWFYTSKISALPNKNLFGENKGSIELAEFEAQDIDSMEDWVMAELKAKFLLERK
jgi:N-acylneuraminate cytidylyltransferase